MSSGLSASEGGAETNLHAAAWSGDIDWARDEIDSGIDVNVLDSIGETPLHGASAWGRLAMVEFLLNQGADPRIKNIEGDTSLHWACSHGNPSVVQILIESGAVLEENGLGQSPLEIAKKHNRQEIVHWLKNNT